MHLGILKYCYFKTTNIINIIYFFRYYDKRIDGIYDEGKRSYCQKRDIIYNPQNKKGNKLKDGLKYLEVS